MIEAVTLVLLAAVITAMAARRGWWLTRSRSWSMYPALHHGDVVLTRRVRETEPIRRGDVVLIASAELGRPVVKRVVGLPGERVEVGAHGVTLDRIDLREPYVAIHGGPPGSFCVPMQTYFVLGDNRPWSNDSRCWTMPFVPAAAIWGRLAARPLTRRAGRAVQLRGV
ncbi:MAG: signal peptidase I [Hyphomicrobiaceae bacterium]